MKRFMKLFLCTALLATSVPVFAVTTVNVSVRAVVPSTLELSSWIRSADPGVDPYGPGSADASSMDFGTLVFDEDYNIWNASKYFTVFLLAATSGRAYTLQQTNNGVASASSNINTNLIMTPDYQTSDKIGGVAQGLMPPGDSFGSKALSYGVNKIIYNGNAGASRIARAYYGIATGAPGEPSGSAPITTGKPAGTYTGTVTFSVVLK